MNARLTDREYNRLMNEPQLTIEAFADWCEKQPAEKEYKYTAPRVCACGQYASWLGWKGSWLTSETQFWAAADDFAIEPPHTFGALAARLRAAQ